MIMKKSPKREGPLWAEVVRTRLLLDSALDACPNVRYSACDGKQQAAFESVVSCLREHRKAVCRWKSLKQEVLL